MTCCGDAMMVECKSHVYRKASLHARNCCGGGGGGDTGSVMVVVVVVVVVF